MYVFILAHGLNKENLNLNLNLNMFATPNRTDDACQVCHAAIYNNVMMHVQLKTTGLVADIRKKKICYFGHITMHSTLQHPLLERK